MVFSTRAFGIAALATASGVHAGVEKKNLMCANCVDFLNTGDCAVNDVCGDEGFSKEDRDSRKCLDLYCARGLHSDELGHKDIVRSRVQSEDALDVRVTKGHGSRGYDWLRVSVISASNSTQHAKLRDSEFFSTANGGYSANFKYVWKQNALSTRAVEVPKNDAHVLSLGDRLITLPKLPAKGDEVTGVIIADPCIGAVKATNQVLCCREEHWKIRERFGKLMNSFIGSDPNVDYWAMLGDNFYDRDGTVTDEAYSLLSEETKTKPFYAVHGNHDYWVQGAEIRGTPQDQCGTGFTQFYGQDTKSTLDWSKKRTVAEGGPYNLTVDPGANRSPNHWHPLGGCTYTPYENTIYYNALGNVGFLGYSAVHSLAEMKNDIKEACDYFYDNREWLKYVVLLGHWNKQGAGTRPGTDIQNLTSIISANGEIMTESVVADEQDDVLSLASAFSGCTHFGQQNRFKFIAGHEHCNHPIQSGKGFLLGSYGMDDFDCPDGDPKHQQEDKSTHTYGVPVVSTTEGRFRVYYFQTMDEYTRDADYEKLVSCMDEKKTWKGCTHLAQLWLDEPLDASGDFAQQTGAAQVEDKVGETVFA